MNNRLADRFIEAARLGKMDEIETMLFQGVSVNARNDQAENAMHRCAQNGNVAMALLLLHHGIDPDVKDASALNYTPFMWACSLGKNEMVALLMPLVNHDMSDRQGVKAEEKAERYGHTDVLDMLRSFKARKVTKELLRALNSPSP